MAAAKGIRARIKTRNRNEGYAVAGLGEPGAVEAEKIRARIRTRMRDVASCSWAL